MTEPIGFKGTPGKWELRGAYVCSDASADYRKVAVWYEKRDDGVLMANSKRLLAALQEIVRINEEHNRAVEKIIGRPLDWKDTYLDEARAAIAAALGEAE